MGLGIDPYRAWLNVFETRRPLTAYQLLNLPPLLDDHEAISQAAGKQRAAIQTHRRGAPQDVWARVNNQLEDAINLLMNPDRKAAYDSNLAERKGGNGHADKSSGRAAGTSPAVGDGLLCHACGQTNPRDHKFCAGCGGGLWEPCLSCGELQKGGERFCGSCGAHVEQLVEQRLKKINDRIDRARLLADRYEFEEALKTLKFPQREPHPRLQVCYALADSLVNDIVQEQEQLAGQAKAAVQQAELCTYTQDYGGALAALEPIPAPLHDDHIRSLLSRVRARQEEISELTETIRQAVAAKKFSGLILSVERLLDLQPDHPQARQLARQLQSVQAKEGEQQRGRLLKTASRAVAAYNYEQARDLLEQIPHSARDEKTHKILDNVRELAYLSWDLRNAPLADATLLGFAGRLLKYKPKDAQAAKLQQQIKSRLEGQQAMQRPFARWAKAPEKTELGPPVDVVLQARNLRIRESSATEVFQAAPGMFGVACGLALQGLQRSRLTIDLLAARNRGSVLGRMSQMMRKKPRSAWGLDLGPSGLKAVRLTLDEKDENLAWMEESAWIQPEKSSDAVDEVERRDTAKAALKEFRDNHSAPADRVCLGIPGSRVLVRFIDLPPVDRKRIPELVNYEARSQIPFELSEVSWDYQLMDQFSGDEGQESLSTSARKVLLVAVKNFHLTELLEVLEDAGLSADLVQGDCLALHNFLAHEYFPPPKNLSPKNDKGGKEEPAAAQRDAESESADPYSPLIASLDVGSEATNVIFSSPSSFWFRNIRLAGDDFTSAISQGLDTSPQKAERLKRQPELAPRVVDVDQALQPVLQELAGEVSRTISSYHNINPRPLERILCFGGGTLQHGLLRYLRIGK